MNRLNKLVISFVLPFLCLLVSVSSAVVINANTPYDDSTSGREISSASTSGSLGGYSTSEITKALRNYITGSDTETFSDIVDSLASQGYSRMFLDVSPDGNRPLYIAYFFPDEFDFDFTYYDGGYGYFGCYSPSGSHIYKYQIGPSGSGYVFRYSFTQDYFTYYQDRFLLQSTSAIPSYYSIINKNNLYFNIKTITREGPSYYWDGTSYFYKNSSSGEPETPTIPTNAEIAQAVQSFYNSDYYKNNTEFDDFMVMYNYKTQYFSFVGHNFGIDLGQVIVPPDYEYDGYSYKQDWWKFFLRNISSEIASKLWNKYYWLYTSNDFGENITYDGKGAISDLIDIHFATSSTIVYSTTDYPVVKIETDENGVLTPVEGTVPGNQYIYDETLDPTTNEYNPLENFIPTNPSQSILGDVNFEEINKVFEENKNILNIEGASWLFTANNKLVGYFTGFLSFLIVLILISRLLGG